MGIPVTLPKLVITATTANSWIYPDVKNWAQTTDKLIEDEIQCAKAGAAKRVNAMAMIIARMVTVLSCR